MNIEYIACPGHRHIDCISGGYRLGTSTQGSTSPGQECEFHTQRNWLHTAAVCSLSACCSVKLVCE